MERPCADSEEKHEPASDIDTAEVDSLKALDPKRPIREATIKRTRRFGRFVPIVLQKSKVAGRRIFAKTRNENQSPIRVTSIASSKSPVSLT
jgi:hypothetical protein